MSTQSAGLAKNMGFNNIAVMLKGAPGWKKSGRPLVASQHFVETGNIVLVDLRPAAAVAAGHIPRAVNIPVAALEDAEDDFPANPAAPVVLYGSEADMAEAYEIVAEWGYKSVSLYPAGPAGWQAAGRQLAKGAAAEEIEWVRKLGPGEVTIADFEKALSGVSEAVIVDVRSDDEAAGGTFAGAIHIPLDEIEARMDELPRDKELYLHCTTGARAEMAWKALTKAGFKASYLVANVECKAAGDCEIGL